NQVRSPRPRKLDIRRRRQFAGASRRRTLNVRLLLSSSFFRSINRVSPARDPCAIATTRNCPLRDLVSVSFPRGNVIPPLQESPAKVKFHLRSLLPIRGGFVHRQTGAGAFRPWSKVITPFKKQPTS